MAITDQQVLNEIQIHLQEDPNNGASYSSGQWTAAEVLNYANLRQYRFLKESKLLLSRTTVPSTPNLTRQPLPPDWIATQRIVFQAFDGSFNQVNQSDSWEADHGVLDWPYNQAFAPLLYSDAETPTLEFEVMPAVNTVGTYNFLYVALSTVLTGAGVAFTVPDEFVPAIKWGVIADMLGKVGRAQDPMRAKYAEARFQEGVDAAATILKGWM